MIKSEAMRIALGAEGVSIWSSELFADAEPSRVRDFLTRAFAVEEVEGVELRRAKAFGRVRHGAAANPAQIWRKLSRVLSAPDSAPLVADRPGAARRVDAGLVYLDGPSSAPVRVTRIGAVLSTWRVRHQGENTLRLWHPVLRNRRDVAFRLEEELAAILGVEAFSANALTAGVSIRFDARATTAERVARELEKAWPRLLDGLDGPPSRTRLVAALGLTGLAYAGQYVVPALRPIAVAGVTLYAFPNVLNATRQLARGEVGVSALYSTGLTFMLVSGMPFTAALMAALMQLWPHLARRKLVRSQRRLFAAQRRRPLWARVVSNDGSELELSVDDLRAGDRIVVRSGETVPVDGVVEDGSAVLVAEAARGWSELEDRSRGDAVAAGALVRDGRLTIRVERAGSQTAASYVDSLLPHAALAHLPSSVEVERIANRNAKPALAVAAVSLLLTRSLRPSQVVIRPDYVTAPRLGAQLSALQGIAHGLRHGVLFRNPAALDRLAAPDVYVIDDSAGLERRSLEVATIHSVRGVSADLVVAYALAAQTNAQSEQGRALAEFASDRTIELPQVQALFRRAGVTRYRDGNGHTIELATPHYLAASEVDVRQRFQKVLRRRRAAPERPDVDPVKAEPALRPLYVLREGVIIGAISFTRTGVLVVEQVVAALKARNPKARFVYLARQDEQEARSLAAAAGVDSAYGGLNAAAKAERIRGLGHETLWIGDGSLAQAREAIAASTVSVSVAPLSRAREDAADVLLPHRGLAGLADLLDIARDHASRIERDYRVVYGANLLGAAGAFVATFTGLHSGLLSNVGTGVVYARHALELDRLAAAAERRTRLTSGAARASRASRPRRLLKRA
jgi:cation transport ATPase